MPGWLEVAIRSFAILAGLFLITKLLGKKQLSKLSFFEYIVGITIGGIAGMLSMELEANLSQGITAILMWTLIPILINLLSLKSKKFRDFVEGRPTVFIKDGKIMESSLRNEKYSIDELLEQLRKKNIFNVSDVEFALLESSGEINTLLKREHRPLTSRDMNISKPPETEPQTVIMDGKVLDGPLASAGCNQVWLKKELEKMNVSIEDVFLGQVDSFGHLTVDLYDDHRQISTQNHYLLLSSIEKCQADLEMFTRAVGDKGAKKLNARTVVKLEETLAKLQAIFKN